MMKVFWAMEHLACQPMYPLDTITKFTGFLVLVHVLDLFPDSCMSYRPFDNTLKTIRITQDSNTSSSLGSREHCERTGLLIIMICGEIRSHHKGQPSNHNSRRHISIWPSLNSITYGVNTAYLIGMYAGYALPTYLRCRIKSSEDYHIVFCETQDS